MIRRATLDDLPEAMRLVVAHYVENAPFTLDSAKVADEIARLVEAGTLWVAGETSLVGMIGICEVAASWYSSDSVLVDRFWFVVPECRAKGIGEALLEEAKAEASRRQLPLFVTVINLRRAASRGRVASIEGFIPVGSRLRITPDRTPADVRD